MDLGLRSPGGSMTGELIEIANAVPWITRLDTSRPCQADAWSRAGGGKCRRSARWRYEQIEVKDDPFAVYDGLDPVRYLCMSHVFSQYGLYGMLEADRYDEWRRKR